MTRDLWSLEAGHVDLARAVSAVARDHAAEPDRGAVQEVQLAIASKPDQIDVGFWRAVRIERRGPRRRAPVRRRRLDARRHDV